MYLIKQIACLAINLTLCLLLATLNKPALLFVGKYIDKLNISDFYFNNVWKSALNARLRLYNHKLATLKLDA